MLFCRGRPLIAAHVHQQARRDRGWTVKTGFTVQKNGKTRKINLSKINWSIYFPTEMNFGPPFSIQPKLLFWNEYFFPEINIYSAFLFSVDRKTVLLDAERVPEAPGPSANILSHQILIEHAINRRPPTSEVTIDRKVGYVLISVICAGL